MGGITVFFIFTLFLFSSCSTNSLLYFKEEKVIEETNDERSYLLMNERLLCAGHCGSF